MRSILVPVPLLIALGLAAGCGGSAGDEGEAAPPPPLEGVAWVVSSGIGVDGWEAVAPTATFEGGSLAGSTGCNRYTASYTVDGESLDIGAIASTRMACPPPADAVEGEYLAALEQVANHRLETDELVLLDAGDTELLRYVVGPPETG